MFHELVGHLKMKYTLAIFLMLSAINSFAQVVDTTSIYFEALRQYCSYLDKNGDKKDEVFIEETIGITTDFPLLIARRTLTIITNANQKDIYQRNQIELFI
jgi:hypothetical protein